MRKLVVLLLLLAVVATGYRFFTGGHGGAGAPPMGGAVPVSVAAVVERDVVAWDEFPGRLTAVERVEIRPRIAGTIDAIHFQESQLVKKDQLLFTIDPKPYQAALQSARAQAEFTHAELLRVAALLPKQFVSKSQYDDKKNAADIAAAALTKAQLDLGYTQIRAPVAGRVSRAEITVGNLVNAGGDVPLLTTIVSVDPIYADMEVDEQSFVRYLSAHNGNPESLNTIPVRLALAGESEFSHEGKIQSFDNELDTRAGTVRVRAIFDNKDGALIPGLYAHMQVGGSGSQNLLLISEQAVGTDQNKKFVYVVGADNKVEYRIITLGPVVEGLRVVNEGLKAGENIVVGGLQRVRPGAMVTPQMVEMDKVASGNLPPTDKPADDKKEEIKK